MKKRDKARDVCRVPPPANALRRNNIAIPLLGDITSSVRGALGLKKEGTLDADLLSKLAPAMRGWITGKPLCEIEKALGGNPDSDSETARVCPRARELIGTVIPRGLLYVMSLASHVTKAINPFAEQNDLTPDVVECLGSAIRRGFDSPELLAFAGGNVGVLSRVRLHAMWNAQAD